MTEAAIMTERLILRRWRADDRIAFAAINADPRVCEFFPSTLNRDQSDAFADRIETHFAEHGFGLWAAEVKNGTPFIGFIGLSVPRFHSHFTPCVEIGWRLAVTHWNKGYATEGARTIVQHAFAMLGLREIVSFTVPANLRSRAVMEKIGMDRDPREDFDHPTIPDNHPLRRHVLYRKARPAVL